MQQDELSVGNVFKTRNAEGSPTQRKIINIKDNMIYYLVSEDNAKSWDGSYALSAKHFIDLVSRGI